MPLVLDPEAAGAIAETWLHEAWATREHFTFAVPPSGLAIEPGDVLSIGDAHRTRQVRVTEISDEGQRLIVALAHNPDVYTQGTPVLRPSGKAQPVAAGRPVVEILDLPLLTDADDGASVHIAVSMPTGSGPSAIYRSASDSGFRLAGMATQSAILGTTLDALPSGPGSRLDRSSRFRVRLDGGTLETATRAAFLAGANAAAVRTAGGAWEVLQFERADLVDAVTYELSGLLRGQLGTEYLIAHFLAAGTRFVLLSSALVPVSVGLDGIGLDYNWRIGPASRDIGHADYREVRHAARGLGLLPFSPVHVRGGSDSSGINVNWTRRTRTGGDSWELLEVPLGEQSESYEVEFISAGIVKRRIMTTSATATYGIEQILADFGTMPTSLTVSVRQLSAVAGRGQPAILALAL